MGFRTFASASLAFYFFAAVHAQTPTQTWTQAPTCSNGLPNPSGQNGTITDKYGATWAMQCGQDSTGFSYDGYEGTNGQGPYGCFKGCDSRPGCTAFMFTGTVTGSNPPQGSGKCYYKQSAGTYYTNATIYGSANLISNGTPQLACPYYNGTTFTASDNTVWRVSCGFGVSGANSASTGSAYTGSISQCMTQCNAISDCTLFSYTYTGAEPADGSTNNQGICQYLKGTYSLTGGGTATSAVAVRVGTATSSTSTATATTSASSVTVAVAVAASSSAAAGCNAAPLPSTPACPESNGQSFLDPCGTNYTVYCGQDCNPGSSSSQSAYSLTQCMQLCDAYTGCQSASYVAGNPGTCYLKTGFTGLTSNSGVQTIVKYIPPNPAFAVPVQAPGVNTSSGCGTPLPAGLTPDGTSVLYQFMNPSDGLQRNYTIHIPKYYDINHASPVIFAFPGNGEAAGNIESETGLSNGVTNPYAIAVYVNGYKLGFASNPAWGVAGSQYSFVDDIGFIKALVANITASFCVDTGRIFATGHSNGGGFTNVLACDPVLSNTFAAFAGNSAACYTNNTSGDPATIDPVNTPVQAQCSPSRQVPWMEIHGTSDGVINYYGGPRNGKILPTIPRLATAWAIRNGLSSVNTTSNPGTGITLYQFGNSNNLGIVTQYTLANWVHAWASVQNGGAPMDATPVIMNFFYKWTNYANTASTSSSSTAIAAGVVASSTSASSSTLATSTLTTSRTSSTSSLPVSVFTASASSTSSSTTSSVSSGLSTVSSTTLSSHPYTSAVSTSTFSSTTFSSSTLSSATASDSLTSSSLTSTSSLAFSLTPSLSVSSSTVVSSSSLSLVVPSSSAIASSSSLSSMLTTSSTAQARPSQSTSQASSASPVTSVSSTSHESSAASSTSSVTTTSTDVAASSSGVANTVPSSSTSIPATSSTGTSVFPATSTSSTSSASASSSTTPTTTPAAVATTSQSSTVLSSTPLSSAASSQSGTTVQQSTPSSSTPSSSATATFIPSLSCPDDDGKNATDGNGNLYTLHCQIDTSGSLVQEVPAANSFRDCYAPCEAEPSCFGFTYAGPSGTNGNGGGTCYLKGGNPVFTTGRAGLVSVLIYKASVVSSTTSSSTTGSSAVNIAATSAAATTTHTGTTSPAATTSALTISATSNHAATSSALSSSSTKASTTSTHTTTSFSAVTATSTAGFSCPDYNNTTVIDSYGVEYQIECGLDTTSGPVNVLPYYTFNGCFAACSSGTHGVCTGFSYVFSTKDCYLKDHTRMTFQQGDSDIVGVINVLYHGTDAVPPSSASTRTPLAATTPATLSTVTISACRNTMTA